MSAMTTNHEPVPVDVLAPESEAPATAYELAMLTALGNPMDEPYPIHSREALVEAFRAGFDAARPDPKRIAKLMERIPRFVPPMPLDEQIRWALDQIACGE